MSMSQQDEPDPGALERQHGRQRRWSRGTKIRASVVAAAIGVVALALILGTRPGEKTTTPVENAPIDSGISVAEPGVPEVDYVIDLNTGVMTPLPRAIIRSVAKPGKSGPPRYAASPDGSRLAYVGTGDEGNRQIFIAGIDGTEVRQMTHDPTGAASPAWSSDGRMIAYEGHGGGDIRNLFVLDVATGESTPVVGAGRVRPWAQPQFTPDGSSLVYTRGLLPACAPDRAGRRREEHDPVRPQPRGYGRRGGRFAVPRRFARDHDGQRARRPRGDPVCGQRRRHGTAIHPRTRLKSFGDLVV